MKKFVPSFVEYRESRLQEAGMTKVIDTHWQSIWEEVKNEQQKIKRVRKEVKLQAVLQQVSGPVRGQLNNSTFQNRIPMGYPSGKVGPAAQLNSRGQGLQSQHQYTDYTQNLRNSRNQKVLQRPAPVTIIIRIIILDKILFQVRKDYLPCLVFEKLRILLK